MKILKQILINSTTAIITIAVIGSAYAAISTVSSGDPLTADSWNQIVNKFDGMWENSVKEYVDATVSASVWDVSTFPTMITSRQTAATLPNALQACRELISNGYSDWRLPELQELIHFYWDTNVISDSDQIWTKSKHISWTNSYYSAVRMNDLHVRTQSYTSVTNFGYYCVR